MVTKAFAGLLSALLLSANGCLVMGCATTEKTQAHQEQMTQNAGTFLEALERAQAEGDVTIQVGGTPLAAGIANDNYVYLGSRDFQLAFKGRVNFKDPVIRSADPALHASLPRNQEALLNYYESLPPNQATLAEIQRLRKEMYVRLGVTE